MAVRSHAGGGGLTSLKSRLPEIMAELPKRSEAVAMEIAELTAEGAKSRAAAQYEGTDPFSIEAELVKAGSWVTGHTVQTDGSGAGISGGGGGVFCAWYWFFGEFGTSRQPARPFMIPAFELALGQVYPAGRAAFTAL